MKKISIIATIAIVALASSCNSLRNSSPEDNIPELKNATFTSNIAQVLVSTKADFDLDESTLNQFNAWAKTSELKDVFNATFTKDSKGVFQNTSIARPSEKVDVFATASYDGSPECSWFDCPAMIIPAQGCDIVYATATNVDCNNTKLEFNHAMASISVKAKLAADVPSNYSIKVEALQLTYISGPMTFLDGLSKNPNYIGEMYSNDIPASLAQEINVILNKTLSDNLCPDAYVFPIGSMDSASPEMNGWSSDYEKEGYSIFASVKVTNNNNGMSKDYYIPISLDSAEQAKLKAGTRVTYNLTFGLNMATFATPTVNSFQSTSTDISYNI